jgi:hypothetical protein
MPRAVLVRLAVLIGLAAFGVADAVSAQEVKQPPKIEVLLDRLDRPGSVAVEAISGDAYVVERGAGRVLRVERRKAIAKGASKATPIVLDLPKSADREQQAVGASLLFLNRSNLTLIQAGEMSPDRLHSFTLNPKDLKPVTFANAAASVGAHAGRESLSLHAMDSNPNELFVRAKASSSAGVMLKSTLKDGALGALRVFLTAERTGLTQPTAITLSPRGELVSVSSSSDGATSLLTFFNGSTGRKLMALPIMLSGVAAVAYAPGSGNLYTLGTGEGQATGLYRIDAAIEAGKPTTKSVKVLEVKRPVAMAFGRKNALFVTVAGDGQSSGQLLQITGEL